MTTDAGVVITSECGKVDIELSFFRTCAMRALGAQKSNRWFPEVAPILTAGIVTAIATGACTIAIFVDAEDVPTATAEFAGKLARMISS